MADAVEYLLRLRNEASPALRSASADFARLEADVRKVNEEIAKVAAASEASDALARLAARGNEVQTAALKLRDLRLEVERLVAAGGNKGLAQAVVGNAERDFAALVAGSNAVTRSVTDVSAATSTAVEHIDDTAVSSKVAAGAVGQLAFQLNDVATMAAMGANPLQILASQGGQIAQVVAQAGGATNLFKSALQAAVPFLTAWGPLLAGAAVALGATAVALKAVSAEADQARADFEAAAAALDLFREAADKAADANDAASGWIEQTTGQVDEFEASLRRQRDSYLEGRASMEAVLQARVTELEQVTQGTAAYTEYDQQLKRAREQLAEWRAETEDTVSTMELATEGLRRNKEITDEQAEAEKRAAAAAKAASDRARELAEAQRAAREEAAAFAATQRELATELQQLADARSMIADLEARGDPIMEATRTAEKYIAEVEKVAVALEAQGRAAEAARLRLLALQAAEAQFSSSVFQGDGTTEPTAWATTATQVAGAVSNPLGAIAGADPTGIAAAVVAGLQAAASLPQTIDAIRRMFLNAIQGLATGGAAVAGLVGDLVSVIVPGLLRAVPAFLTGLIAGLPQLLEQLVGAIPDLAVAFMEATVLLAPRLAVALIEVLANPKVWFDIGKAFVTGLADAFRDLIAALLEPIRALIDAILPGQQFAANNSAVVGRGGANRSAGDGLFRGGGIFDDAEYYTTGYIGRLFGGVKGARAAGGTIPETGLYLMHQDEEVVPAHGVAGGRSAAARGFVGGGGGSTVVVNVSGAMLGTVEDLVRLLNRELGSTGRGLAFNAGAVR